MPVKNPADVRTIIAAMNPVCYRDTMAVIHLKVWFEEVDEPLPVMATPFDCERHSKELWIRAMAGEYGPITVLPVDLDGRMPSLLVNPANELMAVSFSPPNPELKLAMKQFEMPRLIEHDKPRLIEHDSHG